MLPRRTRRDEARDLAALRTGRAGNLAGCRPHLPATGRFALPSPPMDTAVDPDAMLMLACARGDLAAPAPPAATADIAANAVDTPAQQLDKLQLPFAQGHGDQAYHAFRHAHPRWELPPALQAKLRQP